MNARVRAVVGTGLLGGAAAALAVFSTLAATSIEPRTAARLTLAADENESLSPDAPVSATALPPGFTFFREQSSTLPPPPGQTESTLVRTLRYRSSEQPSRTILVTLVSGRSGKSPVNFTAEAANAAKVTATTVRGRTAVVVQNAPDGEPGLLSLKWTETEGLNVFVMGRGNVNVDDLRLVAEGLERG